MAMARSLVFVVFTMFIMLMGSPIEVEGLTCGQVVTSVAPCISYLQGSGTLDAACCNGVKGLNSAAKTPADRRTACTCLVNASKGIARINYALAAGLPSKCGVKIPYKISPSTDCSKVN